MRVLFALLLFALAGLAQATPTVDDVQSAVNRGDYAGAETMMKEVVAARPESAKAHYIYAEILAHQGRISEATDEARTARRLDPQIRFTSPEKFRQFETQLAGAGRGRTSRAAPSDPRVDDAPARNSGSGGGISLWVWVALGIGALWFFLRRRGSYGGGGSPYANNPNGPPPAPGSYPYGAPPNQGSGLGRTIGAGLGGLAAGVLLDRALNSHSDGGHHGDAGSLPPSSGNDGYDEALRDRPIDFGSGSDWGGGGGGDSGGGGGGGFDGGSGGNDW